MIVIMSWLFAFSALGFILVLPIHIRSLEHEKLEKEFGKKQGLKVGRWLGVLANLFHLIFLIGLLISSQPRFSLSQDLIAVVYGIKIYFANLFLSLPFLVLGFWLLYDSEKRPGPETLMGHVTPKKIVTSGSYGLVRHPQYLGSGLFFLGMSLLLGGLYSLLFSPFYFLFCLLLAKKEEEELVREKGKEYQKYQKKVPMFIPLKIKMVNKKVVDIWLWIFIIWSIYRYSFFFPEWLDELVVKPLVFLGPIAWLLKKEKKGWETVGLKKGHFFQDIYLGVFLGILFAVEGLAANYLKYGRFSFAPILPLEEWGVLGVLGLSLATSFSEEILGRGFLFQRIFQKSRRLIKAAGYSSLLFLMLHLPIALRNLSSWTLVVYLFSVFTLGLVNAIIFSVRKTLTLPILIHSFWNMTVALYL